MTGHNKIMNNKLSTKKTTGTGGRPHTHWVDDREKLGISSPKSIRTEETWSRRRRRRMLDDSEKIELIVRTPTSTSPGWSMVEKSMSLRLTMQGTRRYKRKANSHLAILSAIWDQCSSEKTFAEHSPRWIIDSL